MQSNPYIYHKENDDLYFLGNAKKEYVACSKTLIDILDLVGSGLTVSQVASKLDLTEDVVMEGIRNLSNNGFLNSETLSAADSSPKKLHLPRPVKYLKILSTLLLSLLAVSIVVILYTFMFYPQALPTFDNFFWSKRISIDLLTFVLFSVVTLLFHEFSHFVFAKAEGLDSSFSISNRLNYLVVETSLKDVYLLNRKDRILIYLAGISIDVITITPCLALIIYLYSVGDPSSNLSLILLSKQFIIVQISSILWEFLIYMKTDIYFVLENILGTYNLIDFSKNLLSNVFKNKNLWNGMEDIRKKERRTIFIYSIVFILGTIIALTRYVIYHIPISLNVFFVSVRNFNSGILNYDFSTVVDAVVTFGIEAFYLSLLAIIILRKIKLSGISNKGNS